MDQEDMASGDEQEIVLTQTSEQNRFVHSNNQTYIHLKRKGMQRMFKFTLTKYGDVSGDFEKGLPGKYLFVLKTKNDKNQLKRRIVELESEAFSSRKIFQAKVSEGSGLFLFVEPIVTPMVLSSYLEWVQLEYLETEVRSFQYADHVGLLKSDVWFLSNDMQIEGTRVTPELERKYYIGDKEFRRGFLTFTPDLLKRENLNEFFKKLIFYSNAFAINKIPFLQAISFALVRLLKSSDQISADESRYCSLYSKSKNVGKTTVLNILSQGIGISDYSNHLFHLSGGNGLGAGTSSKVQWKALSMTNLIVFMNEVIMTANTANTLLQAHEGFLGGSMTSGLETAKASLFCTSNQIEHEKLEGRFHRIEFKECVYSDEHEGILKNQLKPLVEKNKGYLIAWCCNYKDLYRMAENACKEKLHRIVRKYAFQYQRRFTSSLTNTIIAYCLVFITADVYFDIDQIFKKIVIEFGSSNTSPFIERLSRNLKEALKETGEVLTWINPCSKFAVDRRIYPCVAIRVGKCNLFDDVASHEIESFLKRYGDNCYMASARFARDDSVPLKDINNKVKAKSGRCHKFAWSELPFDLQNEIKKKVGMTGINTDVIGEISNDDENNDNENDVSNEDNVNKENDATDEVPEETEVLSLDDQLVLNDVKNKLINLHEVLFGEIHRQRRVDRRPGGGRKRLYDVMSSTNKDAFKLGYETGLGKRRTACSLRGYDSE